MAEPHTRPTHTAQTNITKYAFDNKRNEWMFIARNQNEQRWTAMNEFLSLWQPLSISTCDAILVARRLTSERFAALFWEIIAAPTRVRRTVFDCSIFIGFVCCMYQIVSSTIWHRCVVLSISLYNKMNCISRHRQRHHGGMRFIGTHVLGILNS